MIRDYVMLNNREVITVDLERVYGDDDNRIESLLRAFKSESMFSVKYELKPTLVEDSKSVTHYMLCNVIKSTAFEECRIWRSVVGLHLRMDEFLDTETGETKYSGKLVLKVFNVENGKLYRNTYLVVPKVTVELMKEKYDEQRAVDYMNGVYQSSLRGLHVDVDQLVKYGASSRDTLAATQEQLEKNKNELFETELQRDAAQAGQAVAIEKAAKLEKAIEKANSEAAAGEGNNFIIPEGVKTKQLMPELIKKTKELVKQFKNTQELDETGKETVEEIENILLQETSNNEYTLEEFEEDLNSSGAYESPFVAIEVIKYLIANGITFSEDFLEIFSE